MSVKDRSWEQVQEKTFTKWFNAQLARGGYTERVENLEKDLDTGVFLHRLLETISGQKLPRLDGGKRMMRFHMVGNVGKCLTFLEKYIKLVNIGPEDIVDHLKRPILGLIWTIILRFEIQDISVEDLTAKDGLLLWCQRKTQGYKDVNVVNFTSSWRDGLAFCALIHKHRPDLIDYDSLSKDNVRDNLELAFSVAEKDLGIPRFLDVDDVDIADERSIMTYLLQYFHAFSSSQKVEAAGKKISGLCGDLMENDRLRSEYETKAREWCEWADGKIDQLTKDKDAADTTNSVEDLQKLLDDIAEYRKNEKPPRSKEKGDLENTYANLQTNLRRSKRPPYVPPEGISPKDIDEKWKKLLEAERYAEKALRDELARQMRIENLAKRFYEKLAKIKQWEKAKKEYLEARPHIDTLTAAQTQLKLLDGYGKLYNDSLGRVDDLHKLGDKLIEMGYKDSDKIKEELAWTDGAWEDLKKDEAEKRKYLEDELAKQKEMEELRLSYAEKAKELSRWYKDNIESVGNESEFGNDLEEVRAYEAKIDESDAALKQESSDKLAEIDKIVERMNELGVKDNKYTMITPEDLKAQEAALLPPGAMEARRDAWKRELERQEIMEAKRIEFAEAAEAFVKWMEELKEKINGLENEDPVPLMEAIKETFQDGKEGQEMLDNLSRINQEAIALQITENKHTKWTIDALEAEWFDETNSVDKYLDSLNDELELKNKFKERAEALMGWINEAKPSLEVREPAKNLREARNMRAAHNDFRTNKKPPKTAEKVALMDLARKITDTMAKSPYHRPDFVPPEGLGPQDIEAAWKALSDAEREQANFVKEELKRHERLAALEKKLHEDAKEIQDWSAKKQQYLESDETPSIHSVDDAQICLHRLKVYNGDHKKREPRIKSLEDDAQVLTDEKQEGAEKANEAVGKTKEAFGALDGLEGAHREQLEAALAKEKEKERLRKLFALESKRYINWVNDRCYGLEDASSSFGKTLEDVRAAGEKVEETATGLKTQSDEKRAAVEKINEDTIAAEAAGINPYTKYNMDDIARAAEKLDKALEEYRAAYAKELERQEKMEAKRIEFAEAAKALEAMLAKDHEEIEALSDESPEALKEAVTARFAEAAAENEQLELVQRLYGEELGMEITSNPHTDLTANGLRKAVREYVTYVNAYVALLTEEAASREKYEKRAEEILAWVNETEGVLSGEGIKPLDGTLAGAQAAMNAFGEYRDGTKPNKVVESDATKAAVEALNKVLAESKYNRPAYKPAENLAPEALDAAFAHLEEVEGAYFAKLSEELARQEALTARAAQVTAAAAELEEWCQESSEDLSREDTSSTVEAAQIAADVLAAFDKDYADFAGTRVQPLKDDAAALATDGYSEAADVQARVDEVVAQYDALAPLRDKRAEVVGAAGEREQKKEALRLEWAKKAGEYVKWINDRFAKINKRAFGSNLEAVKAYGETTLAEESAKIRADNDAKRDELAALDATMKEAGVTDNVHSSQSLADVERFHGNLEEGVAKREKDYAAELERQEKMEAARVDFAEKATALVDALDANTKELEAAQAQEEDPEACLAKVREAYSDEKKQEFAASLAACTAADAAAKALKVADNKHTKHNINSLNRKLKAHDKYFANLVAALEEEKTMRDRKREGEAERAKKEAIESTRSELTELQSKLSAWFDAVSEALEGTPEVASVEAVEALAAEFETLAGEAPLQENQATYDNAKAVAAKLTGELDVPAEETGIADTEAAWEKAAATIAERKAWIPTALEEQKHNAESCKEFARLAEEFHAWVEELKAFQPKEGTAEEQRDELSAFISKANEESGHKKDAIIALDNDLAAKGVKNTETTVTAADLVAEFNQVLDSLEEQRNIYDKEANNTTTTSQEEINEYKELFNKFKDENGTINYIKFKGLLQSLGEEVSDDQAKAVIDSVDTDGNGTIDQAEFIDYMVARNSQGESKEALIEAFQDIAGDRDFVLVSDLSSVLPPDQVKYVEEHAPRLEGRPDAIDFKKWMSESFN